MVIQHNISAMVAGEANRKNVSNLKKKTEKLSTGYKINRSADNASGLSISEKMRSQIRGLSQATNNSNDAISLIQTAEGGLQETEDVLQRMRELAVQSANGTYTDDDREQLQYEVGALKSEIDRISESTEYNEMKLLNGGTGMRFESCRFGTKTNEYGALYGSISENLPIGGGRIYVTSDIGGMYLKFTTGASGKGGENAFYSDEDGLVKQHIQINLVKGEIYTDAQIQKLIDEANIEKCSQAAPGRMSFKSDIGQIIGAECVTGVPAATPGTKFIIKEVPQTGTYNLSVSADNLAGTDKSVSVDNNGTVHINSNAGTYTNQEIVNGIDMNKLKDGLWNKGTIKKDCFHKDQYGNLLDPEPDDPTKSYWDVVGISIQSGYDPNSTDHSQLKVFVNYIDHHSANESVVVDSSEGSYAGVRQVAEGDLSSLLINSGSGTEGSSDYITFTADTYGRAEDYDSVVKNFVISTEQDMSPGKETVEVDNDTETATLHLATGTRYSNADIEKLLSTAGLNYKVSLTDKFSPDGSKDGSIYFNSTGTATANETIAGQGVGYESISDINDRIVFQIGANGTEDQKASMEIINASTAAIGVADVDVSTQNNANKSIDEIDNAIKTVSTYRAKMGALQNRMEHSVNSLNAANENLTASESHIRDTDIAAEMVEYQKDNILQQASQSMLAQANQQTNGVLSLLG